MQKSYTAGRFSYYFAISGISQPSRCTGKGASEISVSPVGRIQRLGEEGNWPHGRYLADGRRTRPGGGAETDEKSTEGAIMRAGWLVYEPSLFT